MLWFRPAIGFLPLQITFEPTPGDLRSHRPNSVVTLSKVNRGPDGQSARVTTAASVPLLLLFLNLASPFGSFPMPLRLEGAQPFRLGQCLLGKLRLPLLFI